MVAFSSCFSFATGCPDLQNRERCRRGQSAPRVPINVWCRAIGRRVESQFRRDWTLFFTMWNYMFRTAVNLSKTIISYTPPTGSGLTEWSGKDIEEGALAICRALQCKYRTPGGRLAEVRGDLSKVRYVEGLPPVAHRLLLNVEHITRQISGTQEVRRAMRHQTHAYRVAYGEPIFVTFFTQRER